MGAHDDARTFEAPNAKAAMKMAKRLMDEARYEGGNDPYAGHIGIAAGISLIPGKPMDIEAARRLIHGYENPKVRAGEYGSWVEGKAQKWGPAILVRIKNRGSRKAKWYLGALVAS